MQAKERLGHRVVQAAGEAATLGQGSGARGIGDLLRAVAAQTLSRNRRCIRVGHRSSVSFPYRVVAAPVDPCWPLCSCSVLPMPATRGLNRSNSETCRTGVMVGPDPLATLTVESTIGRPKVLAVRATETVLRTRRSWSMDVTPRIWFGW